ILVASTNPCKIEACKLAVSRVFPNDSFEYIGISSKSGVSDQPIGDEETRQGSINRVMDALSKWEKNNTTNPRFVIGLEGGVMETRKPIGPATFKSTMQLIAWMAVYDPTRDRWGFGQTGSFFLPTAVVDLVHQGMELGDADDKVFGRVNSGKGTGTVGILTNEIITRSVYYEHALILALIPFIHPEL
ncbi:hypothetical protein WA588_001244, partial [Blastocystis sp. NMH]